MTDEAPHTPTSAAAASSNGFVNSPQSRRQGLPSPWASVVRGDSEQISSPTAAAISSPPPEQGLALDNPVMDSSVPEVQPESSDVNGDGNAGRPRRPAWNRPVNGVVEASPLLSDGVSWPALSESTRFGARSGPDSIRPVSDGPASSSEAPLISQPPQRPANTDVHAHPPPNNTMPNRPKPRSRTSGGGGRGSSSGGGVGGSSSGGGGPSQSNFNRPTAPSPPPFPGMEGTFAIVPPPPPPMVETAARGQRPVGGSDHNSPRNTRRGGNYGPRPRGDGPYHNNHGRRDHDRRDVHLPPPFVPPHQMGYMPPPLPAGPFMPPPGARLFPGPMGFGVPDVTSPYFFMHPEPYRVPLVPAMAPPPMVFPPVDEEPLADKILRQIEYYFSDDNLVKDTYLRSNMDGHGWVPLALIASFPRVKRMTTEIPVILDALSSSLIVEIQDEKLRRRGDWNRWLTSTSVNNEAGSSNTNGPTAVNAMATTFQGVSLNDTNTYANGNMQQEEARQGHTDGLSHEELPNGDDAAEEARQKIIL